MSQALYESDFFEWTQTTASKIRDHRFDDIDLVALAEEIEDLGKSTKRALENRLAVLIAHLLKWDHQRDGRSISWQATVKEQQRRVSKLLKENPSLGAWIASELEDVYESARLLAVRDTGLSESAFPEQCPYSLEEALTYVLELEG